MTTKNTWLDQLYQRIIGLSGHRHANSALAGVSFAESSVFPIPPDIMLIPMVLARPKKAFRIAAVCTIASVLGGVLGYYIGHELYDLVGKPIIELYHQTEKFDGLRDEYNNWGVWIVFIAGITPIPYKVFTITSGVADLNIWIFILASVISRGLRFFGISLVLYIFGDAMRIFIETHLNKLLLSSLALLFIGYLVISWLF
ncbi:MAG: YqaA family protein [Pseudomonadota bacterium]|nr:YqaA family protein [Pseudomonadota bacterium]